MMDRIVSTYKLRCTAMIDAGIEDPESHEGIVFCAGDKNHDSQCPYDYCVVVEHRNAKSFKTEKRRTLAKALYSHQVSQDDIALILGVSRQTVHRYIRGN